MAAVTCCDGNSYQALTSGLNISGAYAVSSISQPGPERGISEGWRDTHAQIEGPAVRLFQSIFFATRVSLGGQVDAEVTAVVISERLASDMEVVLIKDIDTGHEITAAAWQRGSTGERLKETFSRLFNYWL